VRENIWAVGIFSTSLETSDTIVYNIPVAMTWNRGRGCTLLPHPLLFVMDNHQERNKFILWISCRLFLGKRIEHLLYMLWYVNGYNYLVHEYVWPALCVIKSSGWGDNNNSLQHVMGGSVTHCRMIWWLTRIYMVRYVTSFPWLSQTCLLPEISPEPLSVSARTNNICYISTITHVSSLMAL
jgi:hypothetical protein